MNTNDFNQTKLLASLACLDDNNERMKYFLLNSRHLQDYQMIFVDEEFGNDKTKYLSEITDLGFDHNSLYYSNKLYCMNKQHLLN